MTKREGRKGRRKQRRKGGWRGEHLHHFSLLLLLLLHHFSLLLLLLLLLLPPLPLLLPLAEGGRSGRWTRPSSRRACPTNAPVVFSERKKIYTINKHHIPSPPPSLPPSLLPSLSRSLTLSFPPSFLPSLPPSLSPSLPPSIPGIVERRASPIPSSSSRPSAPHPVTKNKGGM